MTIMINLFASLYIFCNIISVCVAIKILGVYNHIYPSKSISIRWTINSLFFSFFVLFGSIAITYYTLKNFNKDLINMKYKK